MKKLSDAARRRAIRASRPTKRPPPKPLQCCHTGCRNLAIYAPRACIPPQGFPLATQPPAKLLFNMPLCPDHVAKLPIARWLANEDGRVRKIADQIINGAFTPSYAQAFVEPVRLDSDEYRNFEKAAKNRATD